MLVVLIFSYAIVIGLSFFNYVEPYIYPLSFIRGKAMDFSANIIFGPFPHAKELIVLKEKYRTEIVVSLLNREFTPENALYESEKKNVESLGMKSASFSLEYLNLNSEHNKNAIQKIIYFMHENADKKIYIHCYLGKHRVGFVKRALEQEGFAISADNQEYFKKISFLSDKFIFGPYPYSMALKALKKKYGVTTIISLLDVSVQQEKSLYEEEKKYAESIDLRTLSFPLVYRSFQSALEDEVNKETLKQLITFLKENKEEKVYIHCYLGQHRVKIVRKALVEAGFMPIDTKGDDNQSKTLTVETFLPTLVPAE